jgi:hypothetical protein
MVLISISEDLKSVLGLVVAVVVLVKKTKAHVFGKKKSFEGLSGGNNEGIV